MADDIDIPEEATAWLESEAIAFFESGGVELPRPSGLAGAEIQAFYDVKREEAACSSAVMVAALARTLYGGKEPPAGTDVEATSSAAATESNAVVPAEWQFLESLGLMAWQERLQAALTAQGGAGKGACGLRAWQENDKNGFDMSLMGMGLKLGHRQKLLLHLRQISI